MAGVFWQGADGNLWVKDGNGVNNRGSFGSAGNQAMINMGQTGAGMYAGYNQIGDPNAPKQGNAADTNTGGTGGAASTGGYSSYGSTGYKSSGPDVGALTNAYNTSFDAQTQGIQNAMDLAQQVANSGKTRADNSYNVQKSGLDQQYSAGNANLDLSQNKLDTSKANSLRDLGNQMRLANQSYSNQLGVAGAGDSSAGDVLNYALSQQANRQHGDMMTSADQQQTGINLQRSQLHAGLDQNKKMLDDWHASQIQNIVNQYATQIQQMQQSLIQAKSQKAIDLAYIGQGQAANDAINQLKGLQSQYNSHLSDLKDAYSNMQAPDAHLGSELTSEYKVNPLSAGTIAQQNLSANSVTTDPTNYFANVNGKKSTDDPYQYAYTQ